MAAQQTGPPTPLSPDSKSAPTASGAILAPPTPVLSAKKDVYELYGGSNYSERSRNCAVQQWEAMLRKPNRLCQRNETRNNDKRATQYAYTYYLATYM
jgi:hypothetical protein